MWGLVGGWTGWGVMGGQRPPGRDVGVKGCGSWCRGGLAGCGLFFHLVGCAGSEMCSSTS